MEQLSAFKQEPTNKQLFLSVNGIRYRKYHHDNFSCFYSIFFNFLQILSWAKDKVILGKGSTFSMTQYSSLQPAIEANQQMWK